LEVDAREIKSIGVTGTIGSGKSAVGKILDSLGVPVIDTDAVVHCLLDQDEQVQDLISERFGKHLLVSTADGASRRVDRKELGRWIFKDADARKDLEAIIHPRVRRECRRLFESFAKEENLRAVATLVPLLFESKNTEPYDVIWAVITKEPILRERLANRDGLTDIEISQRLSAQYSQEKKSSLAERVIDNSGDLAKTREQVETYLEELLDAMTTRP